jgi:hypothetical protein
MDYAVLKPIYRDEEQQWLENKLDWAAGSMH